MAYYGVWKGHKTGVFDSWSECQSQTKGYKGALFKKLKAKNKQEARAEFNQGYSQANSNLNNNNATTKLQKVNAHNYHKQPGIHVFVDGACPGNPAPCASGVAVFANGVLRKLYYGKYIKDGSNNIGELEAALFYLLKIKEINHPITIYIDSQYAIDCFTKWSFKWSKNGWKKSDGKTIENKELVKACYSAYLEVKDLVTVIKVKGHDGILGNELSDRMARLGVIRKQKDWAEYEDLTDIEKILSIKY